MKRVFIDSSVLFSAAYSSRGYSRDLILMAVRRELVLIISQLVIEETRRNLSENAPGVLEMFEILMDVIPFELVSPDRKEVLEASKFVVTKDAPILAAAKRARANLLVTLDKKHFLTKPELRIYAGFPIVTPAEAMTILKD